MCGIIGSIGFDSTKMEQLQKPVRLWQRLWFACARCCRAAGWALCWVIYKRKKIVLTYNDILYDPKNVNSNFFNYKLDMSDPFIKTMYDKYISKNKEPPCYSIVCNHQGYLDIVHLLCKNKGAFVAQDHISKVYGVGKICAPLAPLWVKQLNNYHATYDCVISVLCCILKYYTFATRSGHTKILCTFFFVTRHILLVLVFAVQLSYIIFVLFLCQK